MFPEHLTVQDSVLGVAGNTETGDRWLLSQAHNSSEIMTSIQERE